MNYSKQSGIHAAAFLLLALVLGFCYTIEKVTYTGYTLYRTFPQREQHVSMLRALRAQENEGIEFWTEPSGINRTVDIMVSPNQHFYFSEQIRHSRLPAKRIMNDVGEVIKRTSNVQTRVARMFGLENDNSSSVSPKFFASDNFYLRYQNYPLIEKKLELLASQPEVDLSVIGRSYEGRKLYLVKISTDSNAQKPVIFLDAGHHAREVCDSDCSEAPHDIPTSDDELQSKSNDKLISLLDKYDFWFIPVVNPDGYEYTHKTNRLWRKTRSAYSMWCYGTDPNRNYPFKWGGLGTSNSACDETYAGPKSLSEPETRALANVLLQNRERIAMYVSLHAYSQVILLPYGYDRILPKNYEDMSKVGTAGSQAIYSLRGTRYRVGTSAILLYPAAGASDDYAYETAGIRYSFTIELPDTGRRGFLLPPSEIIPVGQETVSGLASMIKTMDTIESKPK